MRKETRAKREKRANRASFNSKYLWINTLLHSSIMYLAVVKIVVQVIVLLLIASLAWVYTSSPELVLKGQFEGLVYGLALAGGTMGVVMVIDLFYRKKRI